MSSENAAKPSVWRLFVAVDLPDDVKRRLEQIRETLEQSGWKARWTRPETMHLTLRFYGDRPVESVDGLRSGLRNAARQSAPFRLETGAMGTFPNSRRPRVIWLGVQDQSRKLTALAGAIERASRKLGIEPEERPFSPHLTIARVRPEDQPTIADVDERFSELNKLRSLVFDVDHVTLYRSQLQRAGATYTVVDRIDFEVPS